MLLWTNFLPGQDMGLQQGSALLTPLLQVCKGCLRLTAGDAGTTNSQ